MEKFAQLLKHRLVQSSVVVGAVTASGTSVAQTAYDYSTLTADIDWMSVGASLGAVGAAMIAIMVVFKGIKLVVKAVKSA